MHGISDLPNWLRHGLQSRPRCGRAVAVAALACLTGGCQGLNTEWNPKPIEAGQSAIRFDHADFDPELAEYAVGRDPRSGTAIYMARFAGAGAVAVVVASETGPNQVVQERATEGYLRPLLTDAKPVWGQSGRTVVHGSPVSYRMFRLPGQSANCVGFAQLIGQPADDANNAKNFLAGYFCESDARPMSATTVEGLISGVSLNRPR
jgi:hypothetical protein